MTYKMNTDMKILMRNIVTLYLPRKYLSHKDFSTQQKIQRKCFCFLYNFLKQK